MKVLVCGGRDFADKRLVFTVLDQMHQEDTHISHVIHGAARGADDLGRQWAVTRGVTVTPYPANWDRDGSFAGPIRNQLMLDDGKPDLVVAFRGGPGTRDMVSRAKAQRFNVKEID